MVRAELENAIAQALEACGVQAERYAKALCPVDTGLLRNSITHAVGGQEIQKIYRAEYGTNKYKNKKGEIRRYRATAKKAGSVKVGFAVGTIGTLLDHTMYVGSNVYYASYVESGHIIASGGYVEPKPYLRPALENHRNVYKGLIRAHLQGNITP